MIQLDTAKYIDKALAKGQKWKRDFINCDSSYNKLFSSYLDEHGINGVLRIEIERLKANTSTFFRDAGLVLAGAGGGILTALLLIVFIK